MSVWSTTPISLIPDIEILSWSVRQIQNGDHHLVGYNGTEMEGRVSSKIISFDNPTKTAITASGRTYKLVGESGSDPDAEYVWSVWKRINKVKTFVDVSDEYS